jgi:MSHA biogenesis protein MshL
MFKSNIYTTILGCIVVLVLGGCASGNKMPTADKLDNNKENQKAIIKEWESTNSPIQFVQTDNSFLISRKNDIPRRLKIKKINELNIYANSTFFDLVGALSTLDIQLIIKEDGEEGGIKDKKLFLHNFNGDVGELFEIIENTYNLSFNYQKGNVVTLEKDTLYIATVPQNGTVVEFIKTHLTAMGAEEVNASEVGGFVLYKASRQEHEFITEYLNNFYKNFASVKLQLAVLTVNLNSAKNTGFDWSKFGLQLGKLEEFPDTPEISEAIGSGLSDIQAKVGITGNTIGVGLKNKNFNMSAVYNLLSTYGNTETTQSIFVETTSGEKLELRSGQEIPYTSGISSNTNGNTGGVNSGSQTEKEEVGLDIEATPFYDFSKNLVTLEMTMDLRSIIGFVELNAGNGNGTIKQPQTQTQKFNSVLKIRPGEAILVGGIQYDIVSDNRNNISLLDDYNTASKNTEISRNAMFLLLRPTVSVFADFEKEIQSEYK